MSVPSGAQFYVNKYVQYIEVEIVLYDPLCPDREIHKVVMTKRIYAAVFNFAQSA